MLRRGLHAVDDAPVAPGVSTPDAGLITHHNAAEAFHDAFRRRVGRGPGKVSVADLADAIDMPPRTVKAWRDGETLPQWAGMLQLVAHFDPAFASELLERLRDGTFCHVDRAQVAPLLLELSREIEAQARAMMGTSR